MRRCFVEVYYKLKLFYASVMMVGHGPASIIPGRRCGTGDAYDFPNAI